MRNHQAAPDRNGEPRAAIRATIIALATLCALAVAGADWHLAWSDEFNGNSVNTNHWKFEEGNHGGWGNRELEYYTGRAENAYVSNGALHIVARRESTNGFDHTSVRMKTQGLFSQQYGRFEFRAKLPYGKGYWPALWLMPERSRYGGWPGCGEINIMENKGATPGVEQGTIHYANSTGGHLQATKVFRFAENDGVTNFHVYQLDWTSNSISWLVDDQVYETQTNWSTARAPYPAPFDQPFYIIMNLAIGGNYGGNPNTNTVFPGEMVVDYVRVYDKGTTNSAR